MPFQIVVDSCCDLTPEMRGSGLYHNVPLTIYVGESAFRDDMALDTQDLVDAMAMCQEASHTACPAPADYLSMFERCDGDLYVVTLSALLSGSHNSAWQASRLFLEEHPERNIHVFNSCLRLLPGKPSSPPRSPNWPEPGCPLPRWWRRWTRVYHRDEHPFCAGKPGQSEKGRAADPGAVPGHRRPPGSSW